MVSFDRAAARNLLWSVRFLSQAPPPSISSITIITIYSFSFLPPSIIAYYLVRATPITGDIEPGVSDPGDTEVSRVPERLLGREAVELPLQQRRPTKPVSLVQLISIRSTSHEGHPVSVTSVLRSRLRFDSCGLSVSFFSFRPLVFVLRRLLLISPAEFCSYQSQLADLPLRLPALPWLYAK